VQTTTYESKNRYTTGKDIEKALLNHSAFKDVLDKGDDQYLNFEVENAVPTYDIMGKHIFEFRR